VWHLQLAIVLGLIAIDKHSEPCWRAVSPQLKFVQLMLLSLFIWQQLVWHETGSFG
jgi:membrane protein YdbS with pleckstrin-like domain